jgi:UDP-N-acetylmuramate dehydrogenase
MLIDREAPLAPLTTLELGGRASELVELDCLDDLPELIAHANSNNEVPCVLGSGSNVLVADHGYDGLVVHMKTEGVDVHNISQDGAVVFTALAGHSLQQLVDLTIEEGWSGIELLTGIPGTVGATPIQNVGAYGQEVGEVITAVSVWDWQKNRALTLTATECAFGHRTSLFKHLRRWTILSVTFALTKNAFSTPLTYRAVAEAAGVALGEKVPLREAADAVRDVRRKKGMILDSEDPDRRSVGSVFPSPVIEPAMANRLRSLGAPVNNFPDGSTRVSASWLIKEAGFYLGQQLGTGVRISSKHYTLVADDGATATTFASASALVADRVETTSGIRLTAEPDLIGVLPIYDKLAYPYPVS